MRSIEMRLLIGFASLVLCSACNNQAASETAAVETPSTEASKDLVFDKLVGLWTSEDGKSFEHWSRNDNGTYHLVAFKLNGKDTTYTEDINIYQDSGKWVSENKVTGQNDGKAVKFVETALTSNSFQFSNPAHDFPTDINYTLADNNTVNAFIVGPNSKGGKDTIPFNYKRVK